ncbi:MAG: DUF6599 family protein [Bryobacterales bacterium]
MRILIALLVLSTAGSLQAALLPEALGQFVRKSIEPVAPADPALAEELGFEESEKAVYETNDGRKLEIKATRYYDDTGAYSAYLWQKPTQGEEIAHGKRAWKGPDSTLIQIGNYLVETKGDAPLDDDLELMLGYLPRIRMTVDPPVLSYTPASGERPGTARHILGPTSLERLAPEIPPSAAGFHFGAEAYYGEYDTNPGPTRLVLLSYPTPQMASKLPITQARLQKIGGPRCDERGPAHWSPGRGEAAISRRRRSACLARVRYEAEVTMDYKEPERHDDPYRL